VWIRVPFLDLVDLVSFLATAAAFAVFDGENDKGGENVSDGC
jgi:hypothetical protein